MDGILCKSMIYISGFSKTKPSLTLKRLKTNISVVINLEPQENKILKYLFYCIITIERINISPHVKSAFK